MRQLTIGIDASRAIRAKRTGTERYSFEIIRHLLTTPGSTEIDWRLYLPEPASSDFFALPDAEPPFARQVAMRVLPQTRLWTHRRLGAEVATHPPDVLFVPAHVLPFERPGVRLPPSVVTIHDIGYHYFPEAHTRAQRAYLAWSTRYAVDHATRMIAVSQATSGDLQRVYGADAGIITVVHEAATALPEVGVEERRQTLDHYAISPPYALFVGTLQPRKNLVRLLEAYALLRERGKATFQLVLAGAKGWLSEEIHQTVQRFNFGNAVHLTGRVSEVEHACLLQGAHFFVFPSLFEGFGLPILEAQQAGVPVMSANNSSLPEIAGDAAILVDPLDTEAIAEAMLHLSEDESLRASLVEKGYENAKRFSWERAAAETLEVLRAAAEEGAKPKQ